MQRGTTAPSAYAAAAASSAAQGVAGRVSAASPALQVSRVPLQELAARNEADPSSLLRCRVCAAPGPIPAGRQPLDWSGAAVQPGQEAADAAGRLLQDKGLIGVWSRVARVLAV